jgi:hypothetical protein
MRFYVPRPLFCLLLGLAFVAAAQRPRVMIRFFTEANPMPLGGEVFNTTGRLPGSGQTVNLSRMAAISEEDVVSVFPFQAEDGSWGCSLKLGLQGRIRLDTLSVEYHGQRLIGVFNGRPVVAMLIDKRVSDGILTIPSRLTEEDIRRLVKQFPVMGEKRRKAAEKAARKAARSGKPPERLLD